MKFFWVDCTKSDVLDERKGLVTAALESGAAGVIVRGEDMVGVRKLGDLILATFDDAGDVAVIGRQGEGDGTVRLPGQLEDSEDLRKIKELKTAGKEVAGYVEIAGKGYERLAALEAMSADYVVVVGKDWTVIPLENLIAELQKEEVKVIAGVKDAEEAKLAFETLEVGVGGVLLETSDINQIKRASELTQKGVDKLELHAAKITKLKQVGMGDRVCVDTASLLKVGEGMLLGSQGEGLFLIHSETLESEYVASRPFRVNAGAVHAYILAPDGKTRYLSEISAGNEVMAVDAKGNTRSVIVGRVKIEKRPLILVEAECGGMTYKTLLQNAETINLVGRGGKPISIAKLKTGNEVMLYVKMVGRHFGMEVEESVIER
ncbi:MAG: 3-dehydroquinate synthase II [Candidatus Hydrothermarchaeota archaeon]|nr:3-dehydroquinate synthase II [Candidatus Hydrothermarchaeota archaeon]